ncbi:MAG: spore coat polysaccharide biosynthesis predicted glycosyltransferase SpsG [Sphingobacteriales bacterium]
MERTKEISILFRVDAGNEVGLGHFFRSLSLANHLSSNGYKIVFCFNPSDFWGKQSLVIDHECIPLLNPENGMLDIVKEKNISLFYLDGLINLKSSCLQEIRKEVPVVFYHNVTEARFNCDLFILPAIHYDTGYLNDLSQKVILYHGLDYIMLNPAILGHKKGVPKSPSTIVITCGGSDPTNLAETICEAIDFDAFPSLSFKLLRGLDDKKSLKLPHENFSEEPFDFKTILESGLVISAFGVLTFELLFLNKTVFSIGHAPSNEKGSKILDQTFNAVVDLGNRNELLKENLSVRLKEFESGNFDNSNLLVPGNRIMDGKGTERVANLIIKELKK